MQLGRNEAIGWDGIDFGADYPPLCPGNGRKCNEPDNCHQQEWKKTKEKERERYDENQVH